MRVPRTITQLIKPRAYMIGGTLKYRDLIRYELLSWNASARTEYQNALAQYLGVATALTYSTGRSALMEILKALDIGPGDEVLIPGYTCIVIPAAILTLGARPIYADISLQTFNVLPESVEAHLSLRTKAILAQ